MLHVIHSDGLDAHVLDEPDFVAGRYDTAVADLRLVDDLPLTYAVIAAAVVIGGGTWLTGRRLRAFNLTGDE